ncbi:LysR family transcriptional regulator [Edaphobacter aggregans]|uniref:LysR family transcriptional regulator n=1 Tax=Edaphobacter aggregans TaxID=570835 RepID=UPI001FDEBB77|nr:LysR family transcriptional regulator [Edaphobacter aggregans]
MTMRWMQLRQADLNLLVAFMVFAEELNVSAAAKRLLLSQPAASRTLDRLRALFNDDLMVRGPGGYRLTPAGERLQSELGRLLPELDAVMGRPAFDAMTEEATFRITGPDNVCAVLGPLLCRNVLPKALGVRMLFVPWSESAFEDLDRGRVDVALSNDDVLVPEHLRAQMLYRERWSCVVAKESSLPERLTLKQYLEQEHIVVSVLDGVQSIPDKRLAALGEARRWSVRMPYFGAALECIPRTQLVLTATSGVARVARARRELRVIEAPQEITGFGFQAVWHPRLDSDPAHTWLREQLVRLAAEL